MTTTTTSTCSNSDIKAIQDALEVLSGGWKLPILASLSGGAKRFKEIAKDVHGISDKMLSKELRHLEINQLIERTVHNTFPPTVVYSVTEHSKTLREVLDALVNWGSTHRKKIVGKVYAQ